MQFRFSLLALAILSLGATSCGGNNNSESAASDSLAVSARPLSEAEAQAQLIDLFNKVSANMDEIKVLESQMTGADGVQATQIQTDINTLQAELEARKAEIETLKAKLSESGTENSRLLLMIKNLEAQVASNVATIAQLTGQLDEANVQIATLSGTVTELNEAVEEANTQLTQAQQTNAEITQQNTQLDQQANRCYYVIGSNDELKKHNIIQGGFLKKTKVKNDFVGNTYFTPADRRTLLHIATHSKKAKVLSTQPKDSYSITDDASGNKVVNILDPERFWGTVNYLVIQVD